MEDKSIMLFMSSLILLLLLLPPFLFSADAAAAARGAASTSMRLELIHRHRANATLGSLTRSERLRELLHGDIHRHRSMTTQIRRRRRRRRIWEKPPGSCNDSIVMPMRAGRDLGIGQYFVEVSVGSPPQKVMLIADTGSELTWMRCRYKSKNDDNNNNNNNNREISGSPATFEPNRSSTFTTVPCSSRTCKIDLMNLFSLRRCPTPSSPCAYDYRYSDGSGALGIFAYETVTADLTNKVGRKGWETIAIDRVLVGCSQTLVGQSFQVADGVLGLAYSNYSFTSKAAHVFGGTFSYCLVDHLSHMNLSNYLTFGPNTATTSPSMRYAKLELNALTPFYSVDILGISVGGTMLSIPFQVWAPASGGGTIIDSGTSLTFLTQPAYQLVVGALEVELMRFRRLGSDFGPLEYCFDATEGFDESLVPRLVVHFEDGARFEPPVKSYVIDAATGVKCLGLLSAIWPGVSVIGNIMQQDHLWEFNLEDGKLGFVPSSCT